MRRLIVNSRRNSMAFYPLAWLDWSRWFTDWGFNGEMHYLHVHSARDESIHRVYCRHADRPRLSFEGGRLYWLVD